MLSPADVPADLTDSLMGDAEDLGDASLRDPFGEERLHLATAQGAAGVHHLGDPLVKLRDCQRFWLRRQDLAPTVARCSLGAVGLRDALEHLVDIVDGLLQRALQFQERGVYGLVVLGQDEWVAGHGAQ